MHHASVVDTDITGDKFMWYGLHMNPSGRKRIAKIKGHTITTSKSEIPPFSLKWEEVPLATSTVETKMGSTSKNDDGVHKIVARSSSRPNRPPLTSNEDFLYVACSTKPNVVASSVSGDNNVRCRQTCVFDQNLCDLNCCKVQHTKPIIDKDKCTGM